MNDKGEKFPERNARIRALRAQGMSSTQVAMRMGISVNIVAGVFFRDDHPWHHPHRHHPTPEAVSAINARFGVGSRSQA